MKALVTQHIVARAPEKGSEDATRVFQNEQRVIAALADGVGSALEGAAAAKKATELLVDYLRTRPTAWTPRRALFEFSTRINQLLHDEALQRHNAPELLCTLSAVVIEGGRLYGVNIGDSPVFLWRKGTLQPLSQAHTLDEPGMSHVITKALGLEPLVEPFLFEHDIADGDLVLLCSDGVSNVLDAEALSPLFARQATARAIVGSAVERFEEQPDRRDDASAIVIEIKQRGHASQSLLRPLEVCGPLKAGLEIDGLFLERPLQQGDRVWLATNAEGDSVVLKFPPLEAKDDEGRRDGFIREMWQAARVDSPDFAKAWIPNEDPLRYYAMEYLAAPTLAEELEKGPLRVEDTVELARFLLRAASHLLTQDLAHGDIKPENLLVLRENGRLRFVLLDLGSSAAVFSVNNRAGTPSYLAPERFHGGALCETTELFAIGATLYRALTRAFPYGEIERFQTPSFDHAPKRITKINTAVPPWLDSLVMRSLAAVPGQRYQTLSEMAFDLEHPAEVVPFHPGNAPLLERNPLLFFKVTTLVLLLTTLLLLSKVLSR